MSADAVFHRELERDYPVASHARGVYIYDTAGKRYLDGAGSVFVSHIGHGVAEIEAAIGAQMRELAFAHTSYFASERRAALRGQARRDGAARLRQGLDVDLGLPPPTRRR